MDPGDFFVRCGSKRDVSGSSIACKRSEGEQVQIMRCQLSSEMGARNEKHPAHEGAKQFYPLKGKNIGKYGPFF